MKQGKYGMELDQRVELEGAIVVDNCGTLEYEGRLYTAAPEWYVAPESDGRREFEHDVYGTVSVPCVY